jgi:AraC-like DNA-binding protein
MAGTMAGARPMTAVATASADHFDAWSELVAQNFVPLAIQPRGPDRRFGGSLASSAYGSMHVGRVTATPHTVWRDRHHLDEGGTNDVKLSLVLSGRLYLEQGDIHEIVGPGGAAMYNCGDEYRLVLDEPFSLLVLQMDRNELEQRVASDLDGAVVFEPANVFARALWSVARELCPPLAGDVDVSVRSSADDGQVLVDRAHTSAVIGDKMVELLALAVAAQTGGRVASGPGRRELFMRAVSHIERHLADGQLSPRSVAAGIGVSQRLLHALFHEAGDSVMAYIIRQRLERAHAELVDVDRHGRRTITEIAMSWGFKSSSHFSRRFSEHYGASPGDVRVAARPRPT